MDMMLKNRHALVTGGGTGLGAAIAVALVGAGASVTIVGRRRDPLEALAAEHPRIHAVVGDVTHEDSLMAAFAEAISANGPLSIVVANAGAAESAPFARTSLEAFERVIAVNLTGVFLTLREAVRSMADSRWGRLVVISSIAGLRGDCYIAPYSAAKHGAVGLVRSLAMELAKSGITVNAICPGYAATPMLEQSITRIVTRTGRSEEAARELLAGLNADGRIVAPEEVAQAVLDLCLPGSEKVTGQAIQIPKDPS